MEDVKTNSIIPYQADEPRKRHWRSLIVAAILLLVSILTWKFGPAIMEHTRLLLLQHDCASSKSRQDVPVYLGPDRAAELNIKLDSRQWALLWGSGVSERRLIPNPWELFYNRLPQRLTQREHHNATLFLGELTSASGHRRLVAVGACDPFTFPDIRYTIVVPGSLYRNPVILADDKSPEFDQSTKELLFDSFDWPGPLVKGAQRDGIDQSKFTATYFIGEIGATLEARLTDADTIILSFKDPLAIELRVKARKLTIKKESFGR